MQMKPLSAPACASFVASKGPVLFPGETQKEQHHLENPEIINVLGK